jgi:hypothetical protein
VQIIDQSSSEGTIGLGGTKNGLTINIRAKYIPCNDAALHDRQKKLSANMFRVLLPAASVVNDKLEYCIFSLYPVKYFFARGDQHE